MIRFAHVLSTVLLALAIVGVAITFGLRGLQDLELLPTVLTASSDQEFQQARFWCLANGRLTEHLWPAYRLLLVAYWSLKTYRKVAVHRIWDVGLMLLNVVFVLLVTDACGLKTWMWG